MAGPTSGGASSGASRFLASYYVANALLIVTYPLVRTWFLDHSDLKHSRLQSASELYIRVGAVAGACTGTPAPSRRSAAHALPALHLGHSRPYASPRPFTPSYFIHDPAPQERQALSVLFVGVVVKFLRRQSADAFASDAFTYAKGCIALMAFYIDGRVLAYYTIMYTLVMVMFPQPLYAGPSRVEEFTPASFAELVEDRADSDVTWLINFFAPWAPQCLYLEPVIADLSLAYSSEKLRFGKVDVSRWPGLAKKYRINVRGEKGNQLPTLAMFERGAEAGRIPHVYADGKVASGKFRRGDIVTAFALDERKGGGGGAKGATAAKAGGGKAAKKKN